MCQKELYKLKLFHWIFCLVQMIQYMMKDSYTKIGEQDYEVMLPLTRVNLHLISDEFLSLRKQKTPLISEHVDLQTPLIVSKTPGYLWIFFCKLNTLFSKKSEFFLIVR
ncbi:hypothetical protein HUSEC_16720 [Escherichia coli O104:H4 str. LB226692]|nr:hypothetical protein HUSEC41_16373 [Escherichia coli O104:H4 str. 01-09591]EGR73129.1 hypothetical protein HUSEC_16720 [Escherichia coli O104:H4 str. LB226692]